MAVEAQVYEWCRDPATFSENMLGWRLHDYQENIMNDDHRYIAICMGRQMGKSTVVAAKAIYQAISNDDQCILIIAPAERQSKLLYRTIRNKIRANPHLRKALDRDTKEELSFNNGSMIANVPTGEAGDKIRGYSVNLLIVDEAAYVPDEVYRSVMPFLAHTRGQVILLSSAASDSGFFYRAFHPNEEGEDEGSLMWSTHKYPYTVALEASLPDGRPQLSLEDVMLYRRQNTENDFKREYLAEFVGSDAKLFPREIVEAAIIDEDPVYMLDERKMYYMGVDFAKVRDWTVAIVIEVHRQRIDGKVNTQVKIIHGWTTRGTDYSEQIKDVIQIAKAYNVSMLYADETGVGVPLIERLRKCGPTKGVIFSLKSKNDMYKNLQFMFRSRMIKIPKKYHLLVKQLIDIETTVSEVAGYSKIHAPSGKFDDWADALALACTPIRPKYGEMNTNVFNVPKNVKKIMDERLSKDRHSTIRRKNGGISFVQTKSKSSGNSLSRRMRNR